MSEWICTNCGELASSKCPSQRNIFMQDQTLALTASSMCVSGVQNEFKTEITLSLVDYACSASPTEMYKAVYSTLDKLVKADKLLALSCKHSWVRNSLTETTCQLDCVHPNLASEKISPLKRAADNYKEASEALRIALQSNHSVIKNGEVTEAAKDLLLNQIYDYVKSCKTGEQVTYTVKYKRGEDWKTATFPDAEAGNDFKKMLRAQGTKVQ